MGPASIAVEFFRPTKNLSVQSDNSACSGCHRFDDYLSEARGAKDANAPEAVDDSSQADDVEERDDASGAAQPFDDRSDATQSVVVAPIPFSTNLNQVITDADASAASTATISESDANASKAEDPKDVSRQSEIAPNQNASRTVEPQTGAIETKSIELPGDSSSTVDPTRPETTSRLLSQPATHPSQTQTSDAQKTVAGHAVKVDAARVDEHPDQPTVNRENPAKQKQSLEKPTPTIAEPSTKEKAPVVQRESVFDRKVRDSIDDRRVEPANQPANKTESRQSNNDKTDAKQSGPQAESNHRPSRATNTTATTQSFATHVGAADTTSVETTADSAAIKAGSGDSVAVAALRFLVSNATSNGAGNPSFSASAASGQTAITGGVGGFEASAATGNTLVNDLIAGASDRSGGVESLAHTLRTSGVPGRYQATLRLDPPSMGQVRVQLLMRQGGLDIQVDATSKSAAKLIESRMNDLREALSAHGIRVDRVEVVSRAQDSTATGDRHDQTGNDQQQSFAEGADRETSPGAHGWDESRQTYYSEHESVDGSSSGDTIDTVHAFADAAHREGVNQSGNNRIALNVFA